MKRKKAIKIAVSCILKEADRWRFDNQTNVDSTKSTGTLAREKKYAELMDAIKELEAMGSQLKLF